LRAGRTNDQKRALYAHLAEIAARKAGMRPQDIMIVLSENTLPDWSFGNGIAQYAPTV
jgi:4-oxalocrotonate tautomerase